MRYFSLRKVLRKLLPESLRKLIGRPFGEIAQKSPAFDMVYARLLSNIKMRHSTENSFLIDSCGVKVFIPDHNDWWVFFEVFHDEVYEQIFKPERGDIVIDVGAHVGIFTLKAAKQVGEEGLVVAIEPEPRNLLLIEQNMRINNLNNIRIIRKAAGELTGKRKLYLSPWSGGHSLAYKTANSVEVEVASLDNIASELKLERVDFVKIDAEGTELEVLKGAEKLLSSPGTKLAIAAYHHLSSGEPEFPPIISYLKSRGMRVYTKSNHYIYAETTK